MGEYYIMRNFVDYRGNLHCDTENISSCKANSRTLVKKYPALYEGFFLCSQEPATSPCPESD
jgi:hypothetical protein